MRLHINKKLAEIFFLILLLLCMYAQAQKDTKFVHEETLENQKRLMAQTETLEIHTSKDRDFATTTGTAIETENTGNEAEPVKTEKDLSFWTGFVNSLSMIFVVEFGDRV